MASIINASATGVGGVITTADASGVLQLQSNGTTSVEVTNSTFKFNSGYGSVATAYGCRAWVNFNGTGTVAIRASGNVSSITDNGAGDYTVNFTNAMPDANYSVASSANYEHDGVQLYYGLTATRSLLAGSCRIVTGPENTSTAKWLGADNATVCSAFFR